MKLFTQIFSKKSTLKKQVEKNPPQWTEKETLSLNLRQEISLLSADKAQEIVMHFAGLPTDKRLKWAKCVFNEGTTIDSSFYSHAELRYSKNEIVRAFKKYYVLVEDDQTAAEVWQMLWRHVAQIIPAHVQEPFINGHYEESLQVVNNLKDSLNGEATTLKAMRFLNKQGLESFTAKI
jgi:hypothetical protein